MKRYLNVILSAVITAFGITVCTNAFSDKLDLVTKIDTSKTTIQEKSTDLDNIFVALDKLQSTKFIYKHEGKKQIEHSQAIDMIETVISSLPNLKNSKEVRALVTETLIVETHMGGADYSYAANNWHNYGIAQFTKSTAKHVLQRLQKERPDVYAVIMNRYYDKHMSFIHNLSYNVPFGIALCAELYYYTVPAVKEGNHRHLATRIQRAHVWKRAYNTAAGAGTVTGYANAVAKYYSKLK